MSTPTIDDLADEIADREDDARTWLRARNWIERAQTAETAVQEWKRNYEQARQDIDALTASLNACIARLEPR